RPPLPAPTSWSPSALAWPAPDGPSWRGWPAGSWPSGPPGGSPTGPRGRADRVLVERAVSLVADRGLEERRWSTPDLLAVEQRLVESAIGRTGEQTAVASHQAVRDALVAHPSAGPDQQAMVRDL